MEGNVDVSISEIQSYLRCRRAWHYTSQNRLGLVKIGVPSAPLHIGSAVHAALAAQAEGADPQRALTLYFREVEDSYRERYVEAVGVEPSEAEAAQVGEFERQCRELVRRYFDRYGVVEPLGPGIRYVAVEQTFRVPIPDVEDGHLIGTFDGLARDDRNRLWIVDHKSYTKLPDVNKLRFDPQFTAYVWAATALLGEVPEGLLYDGFSRNLPTPPLLLKNGSLSKAWSNAIDYPSYLDAVDGYGLDHAGYADILARLKERDAQAVSPFYVRHALRFSRAQVNDFVAWLPEVYREMTGGPALAPFRRFDGCFVAGTAISLPGGVVKPVEQVQNGDVLLAAASDGAGEITTTTVVETWKRQTDRVVALRFESGLTLYTTPEHPFYVGGAWVEAANCRGGMEVDCLGDHWRPTVGTVRDVQDGFYRTPNDAYDPALNGREARPVEHSVALSNVLGAQDRREQRGDSPEATAGPPRTEDAAAAVGELLSLRNLGREVDPRPHRTAFLRRAADDRQPPMVVPGLRTGEDAEGLAIPLVLDVASESVERESIATKGDHQPVLRSAAHNGHQDAAASRGVPSLPPECDGQRGRGVTAEADGSRGRCTERIAAVCIYNIERTVYNLTCSPHANYFAGGVLVHNCWDCNVRDLCDAQTNGEDVGWLIRTYYHRGDGSQSFKQRDGAEVEVDAAAFA